MKPWPRLIYLTTRITGKSRAMAVNDDSALIAGIPEINLFRALTSVRATEGPATSAPRVTITYARWNINCTKQGDTK